MDIPIPNVIDLKCLPKDDYFVCSLNGQYILSKTVILDKKRFKPQNIKQLQRLYDKPITCYASNRHRQFNKDLDDYIFIFETLRCESGHKIKRFKPIKNQVISSPCPYFPWPCQCKRLIHDMEQM